MDRTLREQLRTHQVVTVVLPTKEGKVLKIRKGTTPEPMQLFTEENIFRLEGSARTRP